MTNIEKLIERIGWQSIDSAPKDGTEILLNIKTNHNQKNNVDIAYWTLNNGGRWTTDYIGEPTHFMPIPTGKEGEIMRVLYDCIKTLNNPNIRYNNPDDVVKLMDDALAKAEELVGEV